MSALSVAHTADGVNRDALTGAAAFAENTAAHCGALSPVELKRTLKLSSCGSKKSVFSVSAPAVTVSNRTWDASRPLLSVTVNRNCPDSLGMPLTTPAESWSPGGRPPPETCHV